ncbi:MAG: hypothetical protein H6822_00970 [Planctomycetaceae bacterium]|nr:hypothetical protein [Planctomycetales bacterium]MCB9920717.1 hypothetical protein [Planctomycetaceae bacterium]
MLWDLIQQSQIHDAQTSAADATRRADQVRHDVDRTQATIDALALSCAAMWELLSEKLGVTEQELIAKIEEIDLRDGKLDGKIGGSKHACSNCGRPNNARRGRCLYCGTVLARKPF